MNKRILLFSILTCFLLPHVLWGQAGVCNAGGCATGTLWGTLQTTTSNTFVPSATGTFAGEYNQYSVTNGQQYEWSLCAADGAVNPTADAQMTLKTTAGVNLCYADDVCGLSPKILWTANFTGTVWVQVNQYNCVTNTNSHTVVWRCVSCPQALPGETQANAINAGTINCGTTYTDTKNNTTYANDYNGQPSADIYYTFTLTTSLTVNISHCNSAFDTYMYLLDNTGTAIASNDNNGPLCNTSRASIQTTLAAGTYYVVSEGAGNNVGSITTEISALGPPPTVTGNTSICVGASTTLTANLAGATGYSWYTTATGGTPISTTANLTVTPGTTTTYYVEAVSGTAVGPQTMIPIPGHQTTFSNSIRGFCFISPVAFTIVGLRVPTDASTGPQSISVVRFTGGTLPPAFPGTTNAFTQLYLTQNNAAAGIIPVSIPINAGDAIGVYGARNDINSYGGTTPIATTIAGQPATLQRTGMQFPLSSSAGGMHDIWQEANYYISRTEVYYNTGTGVCASIRIPVTVTVNPGPTPNTAVSPTCGTTGSITVTPTGGTAPYQYNLNGGTNQASNTFTGLAANTYTVNVQDANGCTGTTTATVSIAPAPSASATPASASCATSTNGSVTITASSGTAPYQYSLNGGAYQAGNTFTNLAAGNYTATVQDANGCTANSIVTVTAPSAIALTPVPAAVSCNGGNDGSILVNANGGTPGYQYAINGGTYGASNSFTNLTANNYTISIQDANGCLSSQIVTVTEPTLLTANVSGSTNVTCNGACDGTAVASASGGTPNYTYSWSNGQTTANASGLCAGTHTCYITDANGCTTTTSVTIAQPALLTASASVTSVITCNGGTGSITVSAVGGTAPYTGTGTFNVAAGTYTYLVSDANGCTASTTITITEPSPVLGSASVTSLIACNGGTGTVTVTASGGTPAYTGTGSFTVNAGTYTYNVSDANGCAASPISITVTEPTLLVANSTSTAIACNGGTATVTVTASGGTTPYTGTGTFTASAGAYNYTVTDANGCTATTSGTLTAPSSLSITLNNTPILCNGGTSTVTVGGLGGTTPYTGTGNFTVSAGTHTYTIADSNGCTATGSITIGEPTLLTASATSTPILCNGGTTIISVSAAGGTPNYTGTGSFAGLVVGTYNYSVNDANGCTATTSITVTEPTLLVANASAPPILCNGGTTTVTVGATGGTPAYTGTGSFVVNAGTYSYPITDANGCPDTASITLTEPTLLTAAIAASSNITCNGACNGSATAAASGGTPNYTYSWSNGQLTANLSGACAGTYTCYIADANGCQTTVNVTLTEPAVLALSTTGTNISCYNACDGAANVSISGGTAPYTILWSNNATLPNLTGLCAGAYNVIVTDANGCQATASITLTQPTALTATITASSNVTCFGLCNGSATVVAAGGTAPYTILWSNSATSGTITGLCAGVYTATITDANGCQATASVTITEPALLTASIASSTNVTCNGACDGTASVSAVGGTLPYNYSWSNAQIGSNATNLCAASYTAFVTDANGCQATAQVALTQPAPLVGTVATVVNANCANQGGAASVSALGGSGAYIFSWDLGGSIVNVTTGANSSLTNIGSGLYNVIIKDQANVNCSTSISVNIAVTGVLSIANQVQTNVTCNGACNGIATVLPTGGGGTYTYSWSNGQNTPTISGLCAGTYSVLVADVQTPSCQASATFNIIEPMTLQANVVSFLNPSCTGANNGSIAVNATGGWGSYTYSWSNGMTGNAITGLDAGSYTVFIEDSLCSTSLTQVLMQPAALAMTVNVTPATCAAANNGSATASVTGGSNNYLYAWSNGSTQPAITNAAPGVYTLVVSDLLSVSCNTSQTVTIGANPDLAVQLAVVQQPSCNTFPDGSVTVEEVTGGSNAYTYTWNTVVPTYNPTVSGLTAGTYTITIQDQGSALCSITQSIDLTGGGVPPTNLVVTPQSDQIICQDNFVQLQVSGTGALTYVWMREGDIVGVGNLHSAVLPGHYYVVAFSGLNSSGCSSVSDSVWVDIKERPDAEIFTDDPVFACKGERIELNALGGDTYQWMMNGQAIAGANQTLYWAMETGTYQLIASNICGSDTSTATALLFSEGPTVDFNFNPSTPFQNQEIKLIDASTNANSWAWSFGDNASSTLQNPTHVYVSDGTYQIVLTVSDAYGCTKAITKEITVRKSGGLYIPNIFTPNGDNVGEEWSIEYSDVTNIELLVFDRWGKYVYQSDNTSTSWNGNDMKGNPCEQGVYFYSLKGKDAAGNIVTYKGTITLLR